MFGEPVQTAEGNEFPTRWSGNEDKIQTLAADVLCVTAKGKPIKAKTVGQKQYVDAIRKNTVTCWCVWQDTPTTSTI